MSLEWEQAVVDAQDPVALGRWWLQALDWVIVNDDPDEFEIRPEADRLPGLIFEPVDERKQIKNRLQLDFRPDDQDAEVERLIAFGASRVDVGQGEASWVVLADSEGNEFCVLRNRPSLAVSRRHREVRPAARLVDSASRRLRRGTPLRSHPAWGPYPRGEPPRCSWLSVAASSRRWSSSSLS